MADTTRRILALDAMGVIYEAADDVDELLIPFVRRNGGIEDADTIASLYRRASLGEITPDDLWSAVGLSSTHEQEYLAQHHVRAGLIGFLDRVHASFDGVCCVSNDVGRWSRRLRDNNCLTKTIKDWYISGEIGARKPHPSIYLAACAALRVQPSNVVFVDDRIENVIAASNLGMTCVLFGRATWAGAAAQDFEQLGSMLS